MTNNSLSFDELLKRTIQEGGPHKTGKHDFYPKTFERASEAFAALKQFADGEVSVPYSMGHFIMIYRLDESRSPDADEFKRFSQQIRQKLIKERQAIYTGELVDALRQKYDVEVDEDLFAMAAPDLNGAILNQPVHLFRAHR